MNGEPDASPLSAGHVRWGILGTGGIAKLFVKDLLAHGHRVTAVGSRTEASGRAFAELFGISSSHGSYEDLVADPEVDVVYVATPHIFHAANATLALEHGKHVLMEKPFTINAAEARQVFEKARAKGLVAVEAMWTRFLPHMRFVREAVANGVIGEVKALRADHTQKLPSDPTHRLNDPLLAGGTLLDLGVYPLSFAHDLLGAPTKVTADGTLKSTGVDASVASVLRHRNGAVSTSYSSSEARGPNTACVLGTDGWIDLASVWYEPTTVIIRRPDDTVVDRFDQPVSGRGMQYQASEVERLIDAGETESPFITASDSVAVMATMDEIRAELGVRYPGEPAAGTGATP